MAGPQQSAVFLDYERNGDARVEKFTPCRLLSSVTMVTTSKSFNVEVRFN
ncbi:Hypothetical predicted protein [Scomber scombrus]|uniref:Uncharacterized protein n=1 Tax=Scomber scombrus TaxID=13677 RepID=A0AAV1MY56_SCOSC